jgi:hypothetical protein
MRCSSARCRTTRQHEPDATTRVPRMIFGRRAAAVILSAAAVELAVVSPTLAARVSEPTACPATAPAAAAGPVANGPVLAGGIVTVRLCRYGTLPKKRLRGEHLTRSHALIDALAKQLNALAPVPTGPTACPVDRGSEVLLRARYRSGKSANVTVGLSGCRVVARGQVRRSIETSPGGPALLARLVRLTS